jgi:integrase
MPTKPLGVYGDGRGGWYFKVTLGRDPLTGRRDQITRRGFRTASEAGRARREVVAKAEAGLIRHTPGGLTVDDLLDLYLDGIDADQQLSAKTRHDYRVYAETYVRRLIGPLKVRDVTPEVILTWQRQLTKAGGTKNAKPLAPNTIRLARAPLAGAFKLAVSTGIVAVSPLVNTPQPKARRSIPHHWTPEQARQFLALMEGDRTYPVWAFLLGSGLRIGELVWLRWPNVDLDAGVARVVEFATYVGYEVVASDGKSRDAVRTIDLDKGLVRVLRAQRAQQASERLAAASYETSDHVFTKPAGGAYHPQYLSRSLGKLTAELGLPRLTAHGLRHTCATLMLANGVPSKVAAERLGHADATLFTNLYSHVTPTMQREAAEKLGAALFGYE